MDGISHNSIWDTVQLFVWMDWEAPWKARGRIAIIRIDIWIPDVPQTPNSQQVCYPLSFAFGVVVTVSVLRYYTASRPLERPQRLHHLVRAAHVEVRKEIFLLGQRCHEDEGSTIFRNAGNITSTKRHIPEDVNLPPLCETNLADIKKSWSMQYQLLCQTEI